MAQGRGGYLRNPCFSAGHRAISNRILACEIRGLERAQERIEQITVKIVIVLSGSPFCHLALGYRIITNEVWGEDAYRTTRMGHGACSRIFSASLPNNKCFQPV
jgi:hypothetical protein